VTGWTARAGGVAEGGGASGAKPGDGLAGGMAGALSTVGGPRGWDRRSARPCPPSSTHTPVDGRPSAPTDSCRMWRPEKQGPDPGYRLWEDNGEAGGLAKRMGAGVGIGRGPYMSSQVLWYRRGRYITLDRPRSSYFTYFQFSTRLYRKLVSKESLSILDYTAHDSHFF
jgi:hypothetical protein